MDLYEEVTSFYEDFRGEKRVIGTSAEGRNLYAVHIGTFTGPQLISQYAIHAREWVTALLGMTHVRRGVAQGGAWVLPLINPDGALLCTEGAFGAHAARLVGINGSGDFSLWKANANAVDLNVNFDARWGTGASNVRTSAPANYIGPSPLSEPETRALAAFTERVSPAATVSWHTKGEVIYWEFHQRGEARRRDLALAEVLAKSTGYPLATAKNSAGGYKDWCIEKRKIPAFTVEVGADSLSHPLGRGAIGGIIARAKDAIFDLSRALG